MNNRDQLFSVSAVFLGWILIVHTQQLTEETGYTAFPTAATPFINFHENMSNFVTPLPEMSYTEAFIMRLAGRKIDFNRLFQEYSLVCPIQDTCGVSYEGHNSSILDVPSECRTCTCDQTCLIDGNCCPGTYYGYLHHECLNTFLYPTEKTLTTYMVDTCLESYTANGTLNELCASQYRPCSSTESGLIYKNTFCATCNHEQNCIPWKLNVECSNYYLLPGIFRSFSEIKAVIDEYDCNIQYQYSDRTYYGCDMTDYFSMDLIDRCNVTGLWRQHNADIEWACENFIHPYKVFKNIFCYICNPSYGTKQDVALIENCSMATNVSFLSFLDDTCTSYPLSDRMKPFKNIYCYACSEGQEMLKNSDTEVVSLLDISEKNDPVTLKTQLSFSLRFQTENKIEVVDRFVHDLMEGTFPFAVINSEHEESSKTYYNFVSFGDIINQYISVCGKKILCNETGEHTGHIYGNPVCGECKCDSDCAENDNCCPETIISKQPYSCLKTEAFPSLSKSAKDNQEWYDESVYGNNSYKIIDTCMNEGHPLSHKCSSYDNASDFLSSIPISTSAPVTYRNIYCYTCNNNKSDVILNIQAYCKTYMEHELYVSVSELLHAVKSYCRKISFTPAEGRQCLKYDPVTASFVGGRKYVRKEMHPSKFEFWVKEQKSVKWSTFITPVKAVYSKCNQTGYLQELDVLTTEVCENETVNIMSLQEYRFEKRVYKNFACFLCNPDFIVSETNWSSVTSDCLSNNSKEWYEHDETLEQLCGVTNSEWRWFPYKNMYCAECNLPPWQRVDVEVYFWDVLSPTVYKYLFSLSPDDFERLDKSSETDDIPDCPGGMFDFSLNHCRLLFCNEGYELFNTTCKPVLEAVSDHIYNISLRLENTDSDGLAQFGKELSGRTNTVDLTDLCLKTSEMITNAFEHTTAFITLQIHCRVPALCLSSGNSAFKDMLFFDISSTKMIEVTTIIEIVYTESITKVRRSLINALNQRYHVKDIHNIDGNLQSVHLRAVETSSSEKRLGSCQFKLNQDDTAIYDQIQHFPYYKVDDFLLCPHVKINLSDTSLEADTLTAFINETGVSFNQSEYIIVGNYLMICVDDYIRKTSNNLSKEAAIDPFVVEKVLQTFALVCTVLSLICLFLTFTIYCLFPSLRTMPGKCVMLLCFSLFCSQGFLQFGLRGASKSVVCILIGICIHYFWMAAFCAMNICSFHMFKVFYLSNLSNELCRNQRRLFIKYFLYFVLCPLTLVLTTVLLSISTSSVSNVGYGENNCFISDFYIFVGTFLAPVCLLFLSNIVFFSLTFHKIRKSPNVQSNQERKNFYIFLKLCTIVGITWPLLIADNVLNIIWFSFVVSGVNSLQGAFIFASFILNRKVKSLFASLLKKKSKQINSNKSSTTSRKYKFTFTSRL